jgi:pSer/pThr/pTyr-binding forkhead associated (FHA) protein
MSTQSAVMPQLQVIAGPLVGVTFAIPVGFSTIGREADAHVYLADAEISRRHATLQRDGGRVILTDLGSTNGTSVSGRRLHGSQELRIGDVIRIGPIELVYGRKGDCTRPNAGQSQALHPTRWRDRRQVLDGILGKLRAGPWRYLQNLYGPWKTCDERLRRWIVATSSNQASRGVRRLADVTSGSDVVT